MTLENERSELFNKWRAAKDAEAWAICDNCARDLLTTLDEKSGISKTLKWFYNEIDQQVNHEKNLLIKIQGRQDPLKRGDYNEGYTLIMRWWASELYNEFYNKFLTEGYITQGE